MVDIWSCHRSKNPLSTRRRFGTIAQASSTGMGASTPPKQPAVIDVTDLATLVACLVVYPVVVTCFFKLKANFVPLPKHCCSQNAQEQQAHSQLQRKELRESEPCVRFPVVPKYKNGTYDVIRLLKLRTYSSVKTCERNRANTFH